MVSSVLTLFSLLSLTTAHFILTYPANRGFDDDKAVNFPCGGFDTVSSSRTDVPLTGFPVQLDMHHTQTNLEVLVAFGDDPGSNYNTVLRPTFAQEGLGNFCVGQISIPESLNISAGTKATIQVVSNGDPDGGLFQCADVTFVDTPLSTDDYNSHCKNGTGVKVTSENIQGNPNETTSSNPSQTSGGAQSASSTGFAAHPTVASWVMGAVGVAGLALL